ncbi:unnamed protein product [Closterium sp. NIES-54]
MVSRATGAAGFTAATPFNLPKLSHPHFTHPLQVLASHQVATSHQVDASGRVPASGPIAASCSCLPRVLPSLLPSLAPPCAPCVEGRLRATPHSSSLRPTTEPFETLHLDVGGPASHPGPERENFFLVVVDDYSRYTTVFPLAKKSEVTSTLVWWLLTTADTRGRRISCLHSDRGGASPTSLWTGSPGVASYFRVWGCLALVRDTSVDKILPRAIPCVFLGFPKDTSGFTFYHHPLHRFFDSRDVRFDESVLYYTRYPCRGLPIPPPPLFLTPTPPPAPQQPSALPPQATTDCEGAGVRSADPGGATSGGVGVGAESVPPRGSGSGGAGVGAEPKSAGGSSLRGAGVSRAVPGGVTTGGAGAPTTGPGESGTGRVAAGGADSGGGATGALESGRGATTAPDTTPPPHPYPTRHQARVRRAPAGATAAGGAAGAAAAAAGAEAAVAAAAAATATGAAGAAAVAAAGATAAAAAATGAAVVAATSASCLWSSDPRSPLSFSYPLPLSPYLRSNPPLSPPLSHAWTSCSPRAHPLSSVPLTDLCTVLFRPSPPRFSPSVLPSPPESALTASLSTPVTDYYRAFRLVLTRVLASLVTDPRASLSFVSTLTAAVNEFASTRCLDYATSLVAAPPTIPMAVRGPWASQWRAAMDSEMTSYTSTGTYVDEVPPLGANVVDGMWIFKVKRPPGSPSVFKARYVAGGFSQCEGVDFFQTFAPTPKMTTLRVLLHVAAQRDYELHSLDFSTAFLQGSLHEEVWLRRPSAFTCTFPPGTQWRLRRPVYSLRQAPREWHDTLHSTLSDLGFQPSSAYLSLFVRRGSTPFFVLVYVDDLVFATADRVPLADVKSELQKRHTCTDLGELRHYLGLQITGDRAGRTITLSQSHMVQQVLQRFELQHSIVQRTPLAVDHRLTGPYPDEPFEPSGPYAELVGCLMYLMTCTRPNLAFPLSILARFVAPGRHRPAHWTAAVRVEKYLATTSGILEGGQYVVLTGHCDSSYADDAETHLSTQGYCFSLGYGAVSWRSTRSSSVSTSTAC